MALFATDDCFFPGRQAARAAVRVLGRTVTIRVVDGKHIQPAASMDRIQRWVLDFLG